MKQNQKAAEPKGIHFENTTVTQESQKGVAILAEAARENAIAIGRIANMMQNMPPVVSITTRD